MAASSPGGLKEPSVRLLRTDASGLPSLGASAAQLLQGVATFGRPIYRRHVVVRSTRDFDMARRCEDLVRGPRNRCVYGGFGAPQGAPRAGERGDDSCERGFERKESSFG